MSFFRIFVKTCFIICVVGISSLSFANTHVLLKTNMGDIEVELFDDKAPITVANFLDYTKSGFYDGTLFHRVIKNFMIQGGGFTKTLQRKEGNKPIKNEAKNGLKNIRGTLAMARQDDKDTATSQFFINLDDNTHLDHRNDTNYGYGYAVFGKVVSGMDVIERISELPTGAAGPFGGDVPARPVILQKVEIQTHSK